MGTHYDEGTGTYYVVEDKHEAEDKAMVDESVIIIDGWYKWSVLRPHFKKQVSTLDAEQRSRLAYFDDFIKRM